MTTPKYGNSGNRWWIAYNTVQSLFSVNPITSPSGYESLPSGNATDDALFAKAAAKTAALATPFPAGKGPVISVENVNWANVNGPYATQAEANTALAKLPIAPSVGSQAGNQAAATANATGLGTVGGFLSALSSSNTWVRVAKVAIGGIILIVGIAKLSGMNSSVAAKAIKVAPFL
jgi:hypothetical protein